MLDEKDFLVLHAMQLAERAHRQIGQLRKAPPGEDQPTYFLHLAEVAWLLRDSGIDDDELIAAAFLHDVLEDCPYDSETLAQAINNQRVVEIIMAVSEIDKSQSWEVRQQEYRERLAHLNDPALFALSCADKTSNLMAMNQWLAKGYDTSSFTKRGYAAQRAKFEALDPLFQNQTPTRLYQRFQQALNEFRSYQPSD